MCAEQIYSLAECVCCQGQGLATNTLGEAINLHHAQWRVIMAIIASLNDKKISYNSENLQIYS